MDRDELYMKMAVRKDDPNHIRPYSGGNGRIDNFLNLVRSGELRGGGHILDVGGSHGDLIDLALREKLFDMGDVLDISAASTYKAKMRGLMAWTIDVDRDGLRTAAGNLSNFDCIVALDFIEHIVDPENFARECYRALKDDGYVFINTPNISYWKHLQSLVVYGKFPHTSGDRDVYHGGHLAFYNENDLLEIFRGAGFSGTFHVFNDPNADPPSSIPPIWMNLLQEAGAKKVSMLSNPNLLVRIEKNK